MKRSSTFTGAASITLCLLPALVGAESGLQSGARTAAVGARARVDFKIVIPSVLALSVLDASESVAGGGTVRVASNARQVSLSAAGAPGDPPAAATPLSPASVASRVAAVVLRAPHHGVIEQSADCVAGSPRAVPMALRRVAPAVVDLTPLLCTASMP